MLTDVIQLFFPKNQVVDIVPFGNGHINDTYKLDVLGMPQNFILQRINTKVFPDPQGIVDTHLRLQKIILKSAGPVTIAEIIPNTKGSFLTIDKEGNAWRLTDFIKNSYTIDVVEQDWQAYQAGFAYGWFAQTCSTLNVTEFKEAIKDFHRLSFRLGQLNDAIANNRAGRLDSIKDIVGFFKEREGKLSQIERLVDEGKIPLRVVHNDTKINNLLFKGQNAAAVIDLDTVGPGILYYDYGDALRTSASSAKEDEKDLSKVYFNMKAFTAFTKGYMQQVSPIITEAEKEYFYLAPVLLTYIMGIRFLADYLNGDTYYKVAYKEHNIDRSKVQKALIESMESHEAEMKEIIKCNLASVSV
jgi:thiamine kinase-like enzyme